MQRCRRRWRYWYLLLHLLMRSSLIEVHTLCASRNKSTASHARTGNNDPCVLASHSQEPFTDGIRSRSLVRSFEAPDATRGSHEQNSTLMCDQYHFHYHISGKRAEDPFFQRNESEMIGEVCFFYLCQAISCKESHNPLRSMLC